jgi:hypothetical protein
MNKLGVLGLTFLLSVPLFGACSGAGTPELFEATTGETRDPNAPPTASPGQGPGQVIAPPMDTALSPPVNPPNGDAGTAPTMDAGTKPHTEELVAVYQKTSKTGAATDNFYTTDPNDGYPGTATLVYYVAAKQAFDEVALYRCPKPSAMFPLHQSVTAKPCAPGIVGQILGYVKTATFCGSVNLTQYDLEGGPKAFAWDLPEKRVQCGDQ